MRNVLRSELTRGKLIAAGQKLFAEQGFAATSTEALLLEAGVTRGALYHHFADKTALFEAVCADLAREAMTAIEQAVAGLETPVEALVAGSLAWMDYMLGPRARRILVLEAPTVLGLERWNRLDAEHSFRLLQEGVGEALADGSLRFGGTADELAVMLNGAMNAMTLRMGSVAESASGRDAVRHLILAFATRRGAG